MGYRCKGIRTANPGSRRWAVLPGHWRKASGAWEGPSATIFASVPPSLYQVICILGNCPCLLAFCRASVMGDCGHRRTCGHPRGKRPASRLSLGGMLDGTRGRFWIPRQWRSWPQVCLRFVEGVLRARSAVPGGICR